MTANDIFIIIIIGIPVLFALFLSLMVFVIEPIVHKYKTHKIKKHHPKWFIMLEDLNIMTTESCRIYNKEISPLKRAIDHAIKYELPYLPQESAKEMENTLETYRNRIAMYQNLCDALDNRADELRKWLKDYNKKYHVDKAWDEE